MSEFENGTLVKCRVTFQDPDTLTYVDPTTVTAIVTDPLGVATTYVYGINAEIQLESAGHYRVEISANTLGTWVCRFVPSGNYQGAKEQSFYIY